MGRFRVAADRFRAADRQMIVAVTGASGFCGAAVARTVAATGARVVTLGRRPGPVGEHRHWDAASGRPDLSGVDAVVHLAAAVGDPGPRQEPWYRAVNVDGTARLLDAAAGRPVVWVGSASVYDPRLDTGLVGEDHPIGGQRNAYGRTKAAGERLALAGGAVVLRPRAVYGLGDRHLLPRLRRAVRGRVVWLPGPDVRQSLTAVENLAGACLSALEWPPGPYNIADATPYDRDGAIRDVFEALLGRSLRVRHVPRGAAYLAAAVAQTLSLPLPVEPRLSRYGVELLARPFVLDLSRALTQGWQPRRTLADYLAELR